MNVRCLLAAVLLALPAARGATYYVDSAAGDDARPGTSPAEAWRSFAPLASRALNAGDELRLKAGGHWLGQQLRLTGAGTAAQPIRVGRYGEGPAPALDGQGRVPATVMLEQPQYWEIADLDVANRAPAASPLLRGIEVHAADAGWLHHIVLRNLTVHDVTGPAANYQDGDNSRKTYGGIAFRIEGQRTPTAWDDVRVENCHIADVSAIGLVFSSTWTRGHRTNDPATWLPSRQVVIRGNTFERTARNGLIVRAAVSPLIEHNLFKACALEGSGNACFAFDCDHALFQYNESCFTKFNHGDVDAAGFDSDWNCRGSIFQYNYSHDNDYGFILLCCNGHGFNDGTIVRDNVSQNDNGTLIRISGTVTHSQIYRNTLYARADMTNPRDPGSPPHILYFKSWGGWSDDTLFRDNVLYDDCPKADYDFGKSRNNRFSHNIIFGAHPPSEPAQER